MLAAKLLGSDELVFEYFVILQNRILVELDFLVDWLSLLEESVDHSQGCRILDVSVAILQLKLHALHHVFGGPLELLRDLAAVPRHVRQLNAYVPEEVVDSRVAVTLARLLRLLNQLLYRLGRLKLPDLPLAVRNRAKQFIQVTLLFPLVVL